MKLTESLFLNIILNISLCSHFFVTETTCECRRRGASVLYHSMTINGKRSLNSSNREVFGACSSKGRVCPAYSILYCYFQRPRSHNSFSFSHSLFCPDPSAFCKIVNYISFTVIFECFGVTELCLDCTMWRNFHCHCMSCYRMDCTVQLQDSCPMQSCPNNCGAVFHSCKLMEHFELCPLLLVPCINQAYGCPVTLVRLNNGRHLERCCASILVCCREWNRESLLKSAKIGTAAEYVSDNLQPDIAFAKRDQSLVESVMSIAKPVRRKHTDVFNKSCPLLPLSCSCVSDSAAVDVSLDSSSDEHEKFASVAPVSRDCYICRTDPVSQHLHVLGRSYNFGEYSGLFDTSKQQSSCSPMKQNSEPKQRLEVPFYVAHQLQMKITVDFYSKTHVKPRGVHSFLCGQTVRRDQYSAHHAQFHNIISGLDGHLLQRCPMALQGCDELHYRFYPDSPDFQIVFNEFLDSFAVKCMLPEAPLHKESETESLTLDQLPLEVLKTILAFLDSGSLFCLSATCQTLRSVAVVFLPNLGATELEWVRMHGPDGKAVWIQKQQKWYFTRMFRPAKWFFSLSPYGSHVQHCAKYDPIIKEKTKVMFFDGP